MYGTRIMKIGAFLTLTLVGSTILFYSCTSGTHKKAPYNLNKPKEEGIVVPYQEMDGVKTIVVKLNGEPMNMIYDTGCSGIHISLNELQTLVKNNKFDENDIIGVSYAAIADGSIIQNGLVNIRELEIGGENGIILENVEASVALNQEAPILLGNTVLDELASVKVDNINKKIIFIKK